MTDFAFPGTMDVTSFDASLVPNVRQTTSPLGGSGQVIDLLGERWRFVVGIPQSARLDSGAQEAFLNRLKGGANRALLWHMARPLPIGTLGGSPTVNGAVAQGASSLVLAGAYPRSNLLRFAQEFDNAGWTKSASVSVTANATTAPDGTTTADKLAEAVTTSLTFNASQAAGSFTAGQSATYSVYVKAAERTQAMIRILAGGAFGTTAYVYVDVSAGTITFASGVTASSVTPAGNGWYRFSITAIASGSGSCSCSVFLASSNINTYPGVVGNGLFVWGAQLESGTDTTAYIGFGTLLAGDMIGVNGMLLQVADDATANSAGAMTVNLVNRCRKSIANGAAVTWNQPTSTFKPVETGGLVTSHSGRIVRETQIEFLEDW